MENSCAIKTGFFVLKGCPNLPQFTCTNCNRSICQQHIRDEGTQPTCVECYAKVHPEKVKFKNQDDDDWEEEDFLSDYWYYSVRSSYYSHHSNFSAFSEDDYDGFDRVGQAEFLDDHDTGSLFDS